MRVRRDAVESGTQMASSLARSWVVGDIDADSAVGKAVGRRSLHMRRRAGIHGRMREVKPEPVEGSFDEYV